eukprot:397580-Pelagomonas_calceolata.AAC.4
MKLQSKLSDFVSVKVKFWQEVTEVAVLLLGGLKLIHGPGILTVFDLHEMDMPLFWKELTRMTGLGSR